MRRVRFVVDQDAAVLAALRLPHMSVAVEEARRHAESSEDELRQAYFEGQRDLIAVITKLMVRRDGYRTEDAVIEGPPVGALRVDLPFLPIPTPKDRSLWR